MLWGRSWALFVPVGLQLPSVFSWEGCDDARSQRPGASGCAPFGDGKDLVLSAGYAFFALTLAPLGFATLTENMLAQKISFAVLVRSPRPLCPTSRGDGRPRRAPREPRRGRGDGLPRRASREPRRGRGDGRP